jgi:hypothetical protein
VAAPASSAISRLVALPDDARTLGPFRLVKQLGKGGFAPVWLAKEVYGDSELRTVAVKLFAAGEATRAQRELIVQEARALCRVEHLNVVRFYALTPGAEGTVLGLVMEYVRGASLDRGLEEVERLPVAEALAVGQAIAWALAAVHAAGLVHRDVKPGNGSKLSRAAALPWAQRPRRACARRRGGAHGRARRRWMPVHGLDSVDRRRLRRELEHMGRPLHGLAPSRTSCTRA